MKTWNVHLNFPDGTKKKLDLYDANRYFGGYITIKRSYFNRLTKTIKMTKRYVTGKAIEKVMNPDGEDWTLNPWILILIKDTEKNKPFWFLIKRKTDLSGLLVAIGPKPYAKYNTYNPEANREVKKIINYIISYLTKFHLTILLPNFISN